MTENEQYATDMANIARLTSGVSKHAAEEPFNKPPLNPFTGALEAPTAAYGVEALPDKDEWDVEGEIPEYKLSERIPPHPEDYDKQKLKKILWAALVIVAMVSLTCLITWSINIL